MPLGVEFKPTIELGHIIQALVGLVTLTGWGLWAYAQIQAQISHEDGAIALLKQRQDQFEIEMTQRRQDDQSFDAEMRQSLKDISNTPSDVRATVGGARDAPARR